MNVDEYLSQVLRVLKPIKLSIVNEGKGDGDLLGFQGGMNLGQVKWLVYWDDDFPC